MLRASWKSLLGRKLRLVMSAMAVVLGVAFVAGSFIFTDMLAGAFNGIVNGTLADVNVQGEDQGGDHNIGATQEISPSVIAQVAKVPGVKSAEGTIQSMPTYLMSKEKKVIATQGPPSLGLSWVDGPAFGGQEGLKVVEGRKPAKWGEVSIDPASLKKSGYHLGDSIKVITQGKYATISAKIVGTATWGNGGGSAGATYAMFDPKTAQKLFLDGKDAYQAIWVTTDKGADLDQVVKDVTKVVPAGLEVKRGDVLAEKLNKEIAEGLSFVSTFLLAFAGIALLVGSFLIVNTFAILVAQRSRELALLRALGASRGQVRRSVLFEAFVVGLVGSTLGLLAGVAIAKGIAALFGMVGLDLGSPTITLAPRTIVASYAVGLLVTVLAAYGPARRAAKVPPVAAMTGDMMTGKAGLGRRAALGVAMAVLGLGAVLVGFLADLGGLRLWLIGIGAVLMLLGVAAASPVIGQPVTAALGALFSRMYGQVGRLAHLNSVRNPRRTAATASALMIGLTLVTAMSILGQSAKASMRDAVTKDMRSDYLVSSVSREPFSTAVADRMAKVDGVEGVYRMRYTQGTVDGQPDGLVGLSQDGFDKVIAQHVVSGTVEGWKAGDAIVDEKTAEKFHARVGSVLQAQVNGAKVPLTVVALTSKDDVLGGVVTPLGSLEKIGLRHQDNQIAVKRAPGADAAAVRAGLDKVVADMPMITVSDQQEFADQQAQSMDRMLMIVFALLALAIIIAILGIVNTLGLSVVERTREIGLLRAIGLSRSQLRRMIRLESVVIALLGSVLGIGMGLLFGIAGQRATASQGVKLLAIPWTIIVGALVAAIVVGILAAVWPAHRAARLDVLRAIQTD